VAVIQATLAGTFALLGADLYRKGKKAEATECYEQVRDLFARLRQAHPTNLEYIVGAADAAFNLAILYEQTGRLADAIKTNEQAREAFVRLLQAQPAVVRYRLSLAGACCNLGNQLRESGKASASLDAFAQAVENLEAIRKKQPDDATARLFLRNTLWGRARSLDLLGRYPAALSDWDQAVKLDAGPQRPFLLAQQARTLARSGDHLRAVEQVNKLVSQGNPSGPFAFTLAGVYALASRAALAESSRPLPEREKRAGGHAKEALALLKRAAEAGFFRDAKNVERAKKGADLEALRGREDFEGFLASLSEKP
jgi:tetratricopeptide (TPR) repeat protein